jgi:hypothetical protein
VTNCLFTCTGTLASARVKVSHICIPSAQGLYLNPPDLPSASKRKTVVAPADSGLLELSDFPLYAIGTATFYRAFERLPLNLDPRVFIDSAPAAQGYGSLPI